MASIIASVRSLVWSLLMLAIIEYIFALIFMNAVAEYLDEPAASRDTNTERKLLVSWGTVYRAVVSLYKASSGGLDWQDISDPLEETGMQYYLLFLVFVAFVFFAVLNILTGIMLQ